MKWIYILIFLVVAASTLGCVDKDKAETSTKTSTQTSVPPGGSVVTPGESAVTSGAVVTPAVAGSSQEVSPAPEDLFGTESNLSAIDTTFNDMNMEITLLDSI